MLLLIYIRKINLSRKKCKKINIKLLFVNKLIVENKNTIVLKLNTDEFVCLVTHVQLFHLSFLSDYIYTLKTCCHSCDIMVI